MILQFFMLSIMTITPDSGEEWVRERREWKGLVDQDLPIVITNLFGDIRTRYIDTQEVFLIANIQKRKTNPAQAEININREGPLTITITFPKGNAPEVTGPRIKSRRVDITVFIPIGSPLRMTTNKGLIEGKGLQSDVVAESQMGNITLSTSGTVQAKSRQGKIIVTFKNTNWRSPPKLETVFGDIHAVFRSNASAKAVVSTTGELTTDYSIDIKHEDKGSRKTGVAIIGKGESHLEITSTHAAIKLLRWANE